MSMELKQVSYVYSGGTGYEKRALDRINLKIEDGEFLGVIGHTGSGKSTLIQMLNGLLAPSEGEIFFHDQNIYGSGFSRRTLRTKVGLVFQYPEYQLFETTVLKDVAFGPKNLGFSEEEALKKAKEALVHAGMEERFWEKSPFELSGGEKRRAAIAGVLAMDPEILVLDEPTAGLDPGGRKELFGQIRQLHEMRGITVLLVSHSMEDVAEYVSRIIVMKEGRLTLDGTPREVFTHKKELEEAGLALPQVTELMYALREKGYDVSTGITTLEEARKELLKLC